MSPFSAPSPTSFGHPTITLSAFLDRFDVIDEEVDGYVVHCPSHTDTHPSLRVAYNDADRKLALKCRAGCSVKDIVKAMDLTMASLFDVAPGDTVARTVKADVGKPSTADRAALAFYLSKAASAFQKLDGMAAAEYVERRFGVTFAKATDLGLGYDDGTLTGGNLGLSRAKYHDAPRLVVPFLDFAGHPHYLQARALGASSVKWSGPVNPEGAAWGKYGYLPGGTGWGEVLITEGPGDGLTSAAVGYDTLFIRGASLFSDNPALADEVADALKGRRIIIAGDADTSGARFTREVARDLSARGLDCHRLTIPEGYDDLTDWHEETGAAFAKAFVIAVQNAPRYGLDQLTMEEISQEITRLFSDVYNANTLLNVIREQGADIRFTAEAGFIVYDPEGVWRVDVAEWSRSQAQTVAPRVQRAVLRSMTDMDARVAAIEDADTRETIGKMLDAQRKKARSGSLVSYVMSTRGIDSMLRELRALPGVHATYEDFDQHPHLLACGNGIINLETGELIPYTEETKDLYLMRRISTDYVPDATCPRWERFVDEIFRGHEGLPGYMQRLIGYGITGHTTEQALAVFYGGGSNGKGVLVETLTGIFKGVSVTTPFSTFEVKPSGGIPNDIAALKGSRLVMASEGEQGRQMAESLIKRLTGGDTISARFMRREFFEFVPTFLIVLATNYKPNFRGQDYGLWRRVKLIPFDRTFSLDDRDAHLTSKFLGRRVPVAAYRPDEDYGSGPSGILAWAVRGAIEWGQDGLKPPAVITKSTAEFRETSDALKDFYDEHLVKEEKATIPAKDAWTLYREWADDEGLQTKDVWKRATLISALEERGAVKRNRSGTQVMVGIRRRKASEHVRHDDEDLLAAVDSGKAPAFSTPSPAE